MDHSMTRRRFLTAAALTAGAAALPGGFLSGKAAAAVPPQITVPDRGIYDTSPASSWTDGFLTGNGEYGAILHGAATLEKVVFNHHRLVLPNGTRTVKPPVISGRLEGVRDKALAGDYSGANSDFASGWSLRWTQTYHRAYELRIATPWPSGRWRSEIWGSRRGAPQDPPTSTPQTRRGVVAVDGLQDAHPVLPHCNTRAILQSRCCVAERRWPARQPGATSEISARTRGSIASRMGPTASTPCPGGSSSWPVEVPLAGEDGSGVTAPHGDDDVGHLDRLHPESLRGLGGDVDADLLHRLHDGRVDDIRGSRARGADPDAVARKVREEGGGPSRRLVHRAFTRRLRRAARW
jgi:hypothetical protein